MAENDEISKTRDSLRENFDRIDASKKKLAETVEGINNKRDEYVNKIVKKNVTEDYLKIHFKNFEKYMATPGNTKESFIDDRDQLTLEQKISIMADYTTNTKIYVGDDDPRVKLGEIADRKSENKIRYAEMGKKIIDEYSRILNENASKINGLKNIIETKKNSLASVDNKLQEAALQPDEVIGDHGRTTATNNKEATIKILEDQKIKLQEEIEKLKEELKEFVKLQTEFEAELSDRNDEIQKFLQEQNIYIYNKKDMNKKEEKKKEMSNNDNTTPINNVQRNNGNNDIAKSKAMMVDFMNSAPERQRYLLNTMDNQGILDMCRNLSGLDRKRFEVIMDERIDELPNKEVKFGNEIITKKELKNPKDLDNIQLKAIRKEIDDFNDDFENKTIDEIETFEKKLRYIRASSLIYEIGKGRGFAKLFGGTDRKDNRFFELSKSLARYASISAKRLQIRDSWRDELRASVNRAPMNELTKNGEDKLKARNDGRLNDR